MTRTQSETDPTFPLWEEERDSQGEVLCGVRFPGLPRCYGRWCADHVHVANRPRNWPERHFALAMRKTTAFRSVTA